LTRWSSGGRKHAAASDEDMIAIAITITTANAVMRPIGHPPASQFATAILTSTAVASSRGLSRGWRRHAASPASIARSSSRRGARPEVSAAARSVS